MSKPRGEFSRDDDRVDAEEDEVIVQELTAIAGDAAIAPQAVDLILVAKNLERVADHATNIAEDVILIIEAQNVKHADEARRDHLACARARTWSNRARSSCSGGTEGRRNFR